MARGERLGRYTLIEKIAIGGMAEIWLSHMDGLEGFEKFLVIKKIKPHLALQSSFVKMFLNEARLAAQLNHPQIVQIYDLGKIEETYFMAMEYIFGRDLSEILRKAKEKEIRWPTEYAIKIISQVCEGLHYAHTKTDRLGEPLHIVHRDISPQNIFLSFDGNVKILDFGIAKAANRLEQTQEGMLKGKVSYMSPEQVIGYEVDSRSDIFSLGTVLYELITGFRLFSGESDLAILKSIAEGQIHPPSYFNQEIPWDLESIILKSLAKEPEKRYQSALEMQYDLNRLISSFQFHPTPLHLSNFLKQLFADEIQRELRYLDKKIAEVLHKKDSSGRHSTLTSVLGAEAILEDKPPAPKPAILPKRPEPSQEAFLDVSDAIDDLQDDDHTALSGLPRSERSGDTDPDLQALLGEAEPIDLAEVSDIIELPMLEADQEPSDPTRKFRMAAPEQETPTSLVPLPQALPYHGAADAILVTLPFRAEEIRDLRKLALRQGLSLEAFLHDLIRDALARRQKHAPAKPSS